MSIFEKIKTRLKAYKFLVNYTGSYLHQSGWMASLQSGKPMTTDGEPLPWMNYPMISFLNERLLENMTVFEYGSGHSTLFLACRVRFVKSVEHDEMWYKKLLQAIPENVELILADADSDGDYCRSIHKTNKIYDIVFVDGEDRLHCMREGFSKLNENGVLILDDSNRPDYEPGFELAAGLGYRTLHFEGLKPTDFITDKSTIFYRDNNCFSI